MKIFSWNVNGLRSVVSKNFAEFVDGFRPDILCLQETRIPEIKAASLDIPFKYKYYNSGDRAGYAGVAIFSNIEPARVENVSLEGSPSEGRMISADFGGVVVNSLYAPNSQDGLRRLDFKHDWNMKLVERLSATENNILCGDLNVARSDIDLAFPDANRESAGFSEVERSDIQTILEKLDLSDVWRERNPESKKYSWWSFRNFARKKNLGWRIDYVLVSRGLLPRVVGAEIFDNVAGSDHAPVMIELK